MSDVDSTLDELQAAQREADEALKTYLALQKEIERLKATALRKLLDAATLGCIGK